jgi:acetyltransferase-like isoleucine patch superfamily enzyme
MKFLISDISISISNLISYFYWNFKGVRVVPQSSVSRKAKLSNCSIFGRSVVLDEAVVGSNTYMTDSYIQHATIGDFCSIAPGVKVGLEEHDIANFSTHPSTYNSKQFVASRGRAVIGNHVWLAANCIVLQGVTVGDHVVIAAGAVVTSDVPAGEIWGGIPARFLKKREV